MVLIITCHHDDVIKWKHFPRNWPFVREIHRSLVNFPHKGQWRGALMFSLIYAWINDWVNNRDAGDLRRQHGHYDVIVMSTWLMLVGELVVVWHLSALFIGGIWLRWLSILVICVITSIKVIFMVLPKLVLQFQGNISLHFSNAEFNF